MDANKLREGLIRFHAIMQNHDFESALAEYHGKTEGPDGTIDNKLYTAVEHTVTSLLAPSEDQPNE